MVLRKHLQNDRNTDTLFTADRAASSQLILKQLCLFGSLMAPLQDPCGSATSTWIVTQAHSDVKYRVQMALVLTRSSESPGRSSSSVSCCNVNAVIFIVISTSLWAQAMLPYRQRVKPPILAKTKKLYFVSHDLGFILLSLKLMSPYMYMYRYMYILVCRNLQRSKLHATTPKGFASGLL